MRIRAGTIVRTLRPSTSPDRIDGEWVVLHVSSALSGPGYFLHVAPVGAPRADFYAYYYPHWSKGEDHV